MDGGNEKPITFAAMGFTEDDLKAMMDRVRARKAARTGPMVVNEVKLRGKGSGPSESAIQRRCVAWFRSSYPGSILFAIPNGGGRTKTQGAILKAEGVLAGVPDLLLAHACGQNHGLFIEMKRDNGYPSADQKKLMEALSRNGYRCVICRSEDSFKDEVISYMNQ